MNIFYAPPDQFTESSVELRGQEARHVSRVLRYAEGDRVTVVDGAGGWFEGTVTRILKDSVTVIIEKRIRKDPVVPERVLAIGIIKKRDRLEFAVEKAVELGVSGIILFKSEHTVKEKIKLSRLESVVISAMKQSLRAYMPEVSVCNSSDEVQDRFPGHRLYVAYEKTSPESSFPEEGELAVDEKLLLMVGPEGGFSDKEIERLTNRGAGTVSLGGNRLRTETAAIALLSRFV